MPMLAERQNRWDYGPGLWDLLRWSLAKTKPP
jgi:hypothetical protein